MKKIEAIIRHCKLKDVAEKLYAHGFAAMTFTEVHGLGHEPGLKAIYRGGEVAPRFVQRHKLDLIVADDRAGDAIDAIYALPTLDTWATVESSLPTWIPPFTFELAKRLALDILQTPERQRGELAVVARSASLPTGGAGAMARAVPQRCTAAWAAISCPAGVLL